MYIYMCTYTNTHMNTHLHVCTHALTPAHGHMDTVRSHGHCSVLGSPSLQSCEIWITVSIALLLWAGSLDWTGQSLYSPLMGHEMPAILLGESSKPHAKVPGHPSFFYSWTGFVYLTVLDTNADSSDT